MIGKNDGSPTGLGEGGSILAVASFVYKPCSISDRPYWVSAEWDPENGYIDEALVLRRVKKGLKTSQRKSKNGMVWGSVSPVDLIN